MMLNFEIIWGFLKLVMSINLSNHLQGSSIV